MAEVRFPAEAKEFSVLHSVQTGSGTHPDPYPNGTGGDFLGVKRPESEVDDSPSPSTEVNNDEAIPPLPHTYVAIDPSKLDLI
jgi:hypothetical protein